jgi:GNAT superfamily N-acetyltransferase
MSGYRFCRTDDIGLLVDALNRCWAPHFPNEPPMTPAAFKRSIRDLQIWCSRCMVAFAGDDPIGVLIGAKRPAATLVHKIAVHPDHLRQGHARHMLDSLGSKLAILGPRRIVAEVPEALGPAAALFAACGYEREARLTDHSCVPDRDGPGTAAGLVIPFSVADLIANGLLESNYPPTCWERSVDTLMARRDEIEGFAVISDERVEAYILYIKDEILALRTPADDGGASLKQLLLQPGFTPLRLSKAHPAEIPRDLLERLGFRASHEHLLYGATLR